MERLANRYEASDIASALIPSARALMRRADNGAVIIITACNPAKRRARLDSFPGTYRQYRYRR